MENRFTLITGGSSGLGRSLALECAKRGRNLILVALPGPELQQTSEEIRASYPVDVRILAVDLAEDNGPKRVFEWCAGLGLKVDFLINNAGLAGSAAFEASGPEYSDVRIMLNIRALTLLTRYFIPLLKESPGARILNIGSLSGFFPVPNKSVYSASKAYVLSFSASLATELAGSGITVTVVCPNGIETNHLSKARLQTHGYWGKMVSINIDKLASQSIMKSEQGERIYVPLLVNRILVLVSKILPDKTLGRILEKEFRKELKY